MPETNADVTRIMDGDGQVTEADLKTMTAEQIERARLDGRLAHVLATPNARSRKRHSA